MKSYNHKKIEAKWQSKWETQRLYETAQKVNGKENFYALVEFPYPSGNLHIGHWYAFAVPDIYIRAKRMQGYNVMYPIGFDSFGLPAENAAISRKLDPKKWTCDNIDYMRKQLKSMGNSFDWSREIITSEPEYYKWTQWFFLKMYEKGLVYKAKAEVNWDPVDKTVLANEQVLPDGRAERSGAMVEKKELNQWFFKITDYADRLLEDLEGLKWPEEIKHAQRNWIGKSKGVNIFFQLDKSHTILPAFTTRPDTIYSVTFLAMAPENPMIKELVKGTKYAKGAEKFAEKIKVQSILDRTNELKEKEGFFIGRYAINPASGEKVPIYIANFALMYGSGVVMCDAHDIRDFKFARKYKIPLKFVISKDGKEIDATSANQAYTADGVLFNSGQFSGMTNTEALQKIADWLVRQKKAEKKTNYKIRDWLLSRQRYWGTPIPIVYDPLGKAHAVSYEDLPWTLPKDVNFELTGKSPLATSKELKERTEKIYGKGWTPEVETMDTFVDSSWYFLRYTDPKNKQEFASKEAMEQWMPVQFYSGGAEHTTKHLLYSRFFYKVLHDLGLVSLVEPYKDRFNRGLILGPDGDKMSKSKSNVVDPDKEVERIGADTVKMYLAFIGPYDEAGSYPWNLGGIAGIRRFLEKVWKLEQKIEPDFENLEKETQILLDSTIKKVTDDIGSLSFNTAISAMMILVNRMEKEKKIGKTHYETLLKILAPFAPHLSEELWHKLGNSNSIHLCQWPKYDEKNLKLVKKTIVIAVDGKVKERFEFENIPDEAEIKKMALQNKKVMKALENKKALRFIYVKDRLFNIATK